MMRSESNGRDGGARPTAIWLRVLVGLAMLATVIVVLLPQAGSSAADLRPLALGLVGLGIVAWLAGRRRRQATPPRRRYSSDAATSREPVR
jgi:hypothetical protein